MACLGRGTGGAGGARHTLGAEEERRGNSAHARVGCADFLIGRVGGLDSTALDRK